LALIISSLVAVAAVDRLETALILLTKWVAAALEDLGLLLPKLLLKEIIQQL
jgi:hypothetical protein